MTGGPISDQRLVRCVGNNVTFKARSGDKNRPKLQVDVRLTATEFVRRWSLHILPKGFTKSRGYGGFSSRNRTAFIALCQRLQPVMVETLEAAQPTPANSDEPLAERLPGCPKCQQPMPLVSHTYRPAWRDLMYGPDHPPWFES